MISVSGTSPVYQNPLPSKVKTKDTDGDNDGSKTATAPAALSPAISNPTDTMGKHVDTHA